MAVARFQKGKRLTPDGVVGPLTMILLYNAVPDYQHPRLSEFTERIANLSHLAQPHPEPPIRGPQW